MATILFIIKTKVQSVVPDAEVYLFGSRAYGVPSDESDWDILILTKQPSTPGIKNRIHAALFPVSIQIGSFINFVLVDKTNWSNNPSYYALKKETEGKMMLAGVRKLIQSN